MWDALEILAIKFDFSLSGNILASSESPPENGNPISCPELAYHEYLRYVIFEDIGNMTDFCGIFLIQEVSYFHITSIYVHL